MSERVFRFGVILLGSRGIWVRVRFFVEVLGFIFEIEVSGVIGVLRDSAGVNFERVYVVWVFGYYYVVLLVVIDWFV